MTLFTFTLKSLQSFLWKLIKVIMKKYERKRNKIEFNKI